MVRGKGLAMEGKLLRSTMMVLSAMALSLLLPATVNCAPISIDFNLCVPAVYPLNPVNLTGPTETSVCCPIPPTKPVIDGPPPLSTNTIRVRQASQCTDAAYAAKIKKAYALMRALPDDDPRSFHQQWSLHCSYCGGSFLNFNSTGGAEGIDIHFSWLFFPWHRWFLYFHERILQSLLDDPTFSLNYWNWDSPYSVGDGSSKNGACLKSGHHFPTIFSDPSAATYDGNRSNNAKGIGRINFPDFYYVPGLPDYLQPNSSAPDGRLITSNLNIMYQSMVSGGTTTETFMGRPFRSGEHKGLPGQSGGAGSLESSAHATVHFWTGADPPTLDDMGQLGHSARDPVFYAHHSNLDRLWQVWKDLGPFLGQKHEDYSDPDFLHAEFLFYDENKDVRRVKVEDALDTTKLGYVYQGANDAAWLFPEMTKCSTLSYFEALARAECEPATPKTDGYYHLQAGTPFVLVTDRQDNPQKLEEFLTIDGIKLDRSCLAGFDVYVQLLSPSDYSLPSVCAEYSGRFTNMAQQQHPSSKSLVWKQSLARTFTDIQFPNNVSKVVITLIPFSQSGGYETIKFKSVTIDAS